MNKNRIKPIMNSIVTMLQIPLKLRNNILLFLSAKGISFSVFNSLYSSSIHTIDDFSLGWNVCRPTSSVDCEWANAWRPGIVKESVEYCMWAASGNMMWFLHRAICSLVLLLLLSRTNSTCWSLFIMMKKLMKKEKRNTYIPSIPLYSPPCLSFSLWPLKQCRVCIHYEN